MQPLVAEVSSAVDSVPREMAVWFRQGGKRMLSEKIYSLRRKNGLSQEQLAEKIGVSRQAVSKWEGGLSTPELDKLRALSECLLQCTKDYNKNGLPTYNFYRSSKERYFTFLKCNDYMLQLRAKLARRLISWIWHWHIWIPTKYSFPAGKND